MGVLSRSISLHAHHVTKQLPLVGRSGVRLETTKQNTSKQGWCAYAICKCSLKHSFSYLKFSTRCPTFNNELLKYQPEPNSVILLFFFFCITLNVLRTGFAFSNNGIPGSKVMLWKHLLLLNLHLFMKQKGALNRLFGMCINLWPSGAGNSLQTFSTWLLKKFLY